MSNHNWSLIRAERSARKDDMPPKWLLALLAVLMAATVLTACFV